MWAVPPQPCSQSGKRRWFSCTTAAPCCPFGAQPSASGNLIASRQAHFSTIARLPSGSSTSHSGAFRDGVLGLRSRYCPPMHGRVGGTSSHPRSARAVSFGVRLRIRSHLCGLWFRASIPPVTISTHICGVCSIPPLSTSPTPRLMLLVHPRYSSIRIFLRIGASL